MWGISSSAHLLLLTHAAMHPRASELESSSSVFPQQHPHQVSSVDPLQGLVENSSLPSGVVLSQPSLQSQSQTGLVF